MSIPAKAAKAIIIDDNKILLLRSNPKLRKKDVWDLPGGLIEDNENYKEALLREVKEETNLTVEIIKKSEKWKFFRDKDGKWVELQNFLCLVKNGNFKISDEHSEFGWFRVEEIKKLKIKDASFLKALEKEVIKN